MKYALVTDQTRKTIHNTLPKDKSFLNTDSIRDQKRRFEISGKWDEGDPLSGLVILILYNFIFQWVNFLYPFCV